MTHNVKANRRCFCRSKKMRRKPLSTINSLAAGAANQHAAKAMERALYVLPNLVCRWPFQRVSVGLPIVRRSCPLSNHQTNHSRLSLRAVQIRSQLPIVNRCAETLALHRPSKMVVNLVRSAMVTVLAVSCNETVPLHFFSFSSALL